MHILRLVVLISGQGSNMLALADAAKSDSSNFQLSAVIADTNAPGLTAAARRGLTTGCVPRGDFATRADFETALSMTIDRHDPDLIVLAGFMRVLSASFCQRYAGQIINIHPSLLPDYKGLDTHRRVLAAGDAEHGCSVHLVTAELDDGPLLGQARLRVQPGEDEAELAVRVLELEHQLLPMVITRLAASRQEGSDALVSDAVIRDAGPLLLDATGAR